MTKKRKQNDGDSWPLTQRPGFLVRRLHQIHVALFQEKCATFAITPLQYSLLSALAVRGTADQSTLAADVALDRTTTTGALKRLQSRNFIQRTIDREDRRARICRLTSAGTRLLARMEASARVAHRDTLTGLSKAEQKSFVAMMQRLVAAHPNHANTAADLDRAA
jgi:DNA-binding MarR family transcriptional regulator